MLRAAGTIFWPLVGASLVLLGWRNDAPRSDDAGFLAPTPPAPPVLRDRLPHELDADPFPHIFMDRIFDPDFYSQLAAGFPDIPAAVAADGQNIGQKSIIFGSPGYLKVIDSSPAWKRLHDWVASQAAVDWGFRAYAPHLEAWRGEANCTVPDKPRYQSYLEDPKKTPRKLDFLYGVRSGRIDPPPHHDPARLYSRMDFFHGKAGVYWLPAHLDWPHRLFSILIYFSDTSPASGGAFRALVPTGQLPNGSKTFRPARTYHPRSNQAISHLSALPTAWHGADLFAGDGGAGERRLVQVQVSMHQSVCREW
ncbi:hypothetical protein DFJ74DRAFT_663219 [Hyaloraphidium curvatum]|nr:hypothetical protein DFJ74DRAFT_663219 [Hyaloraphidium curvatum]